MNPSPESCRLLVADDEPANLRVLAETLRDLGQITIAKNGAEAIDRARAAPPDLMLLDINMPELDGYEVCRRVRSDSRLSSVPVIFCTTLDAEENESLGFDVGGSDYVVKPFSPPIVRARVKTHLELKRHRDHLEALAESRARQLVHAERLATLGTLAAGIAHEINNPLACISMNADLLLHRLRSIPPGATDLLSEFVLSLPEHLQNVVEDSHRIARIVAGMKGYARRGDSEFKLLSLSVPVDNALHLCAHKLKNLETRVELPPDLPPVPIRPSQIEQVLVNLLNNAADAIQESGRNGLVSIRAETSSDRVLLSIEDNGPGIPPGKLETIWDAFYTSKGDKGTGLGLSISRGILQEHAGEIQVRNLPSGGAQFTISIPLRRPENAPG